MLNKKNILRLIMVMIAIIIIISILLIALNRYNKYNELDNQEQSYIDSINNPGKIINGKKPQLLKTDNLFFTVEKCIEKYYEYIENEDKEAIYALLDVEYIEENKVSLDNVLAKIPKYDEMDSYKIREIYVITGDKYSTFYVKTLLNKKEKYYIVNMDSASKAFSIIPLEKEIYDKKINETIKSEQQYEDIIELNQYNKISYVYLEENDVVEKYFQDYLNNVLFNPEIAYDSLNEEYKMAKFGTLEEYKQYIEQNKEIISSMCKKMRRSYEDFEDYKEYEKYYAQVSKNGLDKYKIENDGENKKIICIDTYGNYYIFNIKSIMNYELILDTYTIDLPEFTEKYEVATTQEKVALNIQKIVEALNSKDYNYVYSKLADEFKNNNFKTIEDFEEYAEKTFEVDSQVEFIKYTEANNLYTYKISLTGSKKNVTKTIIMQLQEGTDFVISFNVE